MLDIGFIKKNMYMYKRRNRGRGGSGGGGKSVLVDYQSLRLKNRPIHPPTNYFSLMNVDEMCLIFVSFIEL